MLFALTGLSQEDSPVTIHVVQRGENLFRIALSYGLTTEEVALANGITDPSNISVGQRLIIPIEGINAITPAPQLVSEHIVQVGETLDSIAALHGITAQELAVLNGIVNPNSVYVGQVLQLNVPLASEPVEAETTDPIQAADGNTVRHVVQSGETLFRIATQYEKTVEELQQANGITDPTLIYAGQELIIPGIEAPPPVVNLPIGISSVDLYPTLFSEGKTGRVQLVTPSAGSVTGTFLGTDLIVIPDVSSTIHTMLVAVPIYTEAGVYPMELNVVLADGQSASLTLNIQVLSGAYGTQSIVLPDDRLELLTPAVEQNEISVLMSVTSGFTAEKYFDGPMSLPAAAVMNSPFGTRRSYNGGPVDRYHNGADFAGAPGSPVLAAAAGRVVLADVLNIRGTSIVIDHGWGVYTNYSHLSERYAALGEFVSTGQVIGTVGSSGRATGAHLHWELWVNGVPVDPMQWVREAFP